MDVLWQILCKVGVDMRTHVWHLFMSCSETPALEELKAAVRKFLQREEREVDLKEYRAVINSLDGDFSSVATHAQKAGAHLINGNITAASWIARTATCQSTQLLTGSVSV